MRAYSFDLDVTHLVYETQQRQLMLYPLLIYIFAQAAQAESVAWQSAMTPQQATTLCGKTGDSFASFFKTYALESFAHMAEEYPPVQKSTPPSGTLYILSALPQPEDERQAVYLYDFRMENQKAFLRVTVRAAYTNVEMDAFRQKCQKLCHIYDDFRGI